jgi:hypothetical protein
MALTYIGSYTFKQVKALAWNKSYAGEPDSCTVVFQGAQYLEKSFCDGLTKFQTMQTINGLTVIDEKGNNVGDAHMFLKGWSSDDAPIFPSVTMTFIGCRGGTTPDAIPEDDITIQSASTTKTITDASSPNNGIGISLSIQYKAARTSYTWTALSDPGSTATYSTVRKQLSYSLYGSNMILTKFSGMKDDGGDPSTTISTGDATAVWNSFIAQNFTSSFTSHEVIPGKVWQCSSTNEFILIGT